MKNILYLNKHHMMKTFVGMQIEIYAFLTLAPEVSSQFYSLFYLLHGKRHQYALNRRLGRLTANLKMVEKRKNYFRTATGNHTPVIQPIAW